MASSPQGHVLVMEPLEPWEAGSLSSRTQGEGTLRAPPPSRSGSAGAGWQGRAAPHWGAAQPPCSKPQLCRPPAKAPLPTRASPAPATTGLPVFLKFPALAWLWLLALGDISSLHCALRSFPAWSPAHAPSPSPLMPTPHARFALDTWGCFCPFHSRTRGGPGEAACAEGPRQGRQSGAWEAGSGRPTWSSHCPPPPCPADHQTGAPTGGPDAGKGGCRHRRRGPQPHARP